MKNRLVLGTFKGAEGSLGYSQGKVYALLMQEDEHKAISIRLVADGSGEVVYSTTITFLDNWERVRTLYSYAGKTADETADELAKYLNKV